MNGRTFLGSVAVAGVLMTGCANETTVSGEAASKSPLPQGETVAPTSESLTSGDPGAATSGQESTTGDAKLTDLQSVSAEAIAIYYRCVGVLIGQGLDPNTVYAQAQKPGSELYKRIKVECTAAGKQARALAERIRAARPSGADAQALNQLADDMINQAPAYDQLATIDTFEEFSHACGRKSDGRPLIDDNNCN